MRSCARCGASHDGDSWLRLPLIRYMSDYAGGALEVRRCACGNSLSIECESDAEVRRALRWAMTHMDELEVLELERQRQQSEWCAQKEREALRRAAGG